MVNRRMFFRCRRVSRYTPEKGEPYGSRGGLSSSSCPLEVIALQGSIAINRIANGGLMSHHGRIFDPHSHLLVSGLLGPYPYVSEENGPDGKSL